jgi:glycosyltransferase involved in cell wall biosynthesis
MRKVVFVEASSGGVVGGSLTGLYHTIRGLDRERFAPVMVLYEEKRIEQDLAALRVPVHHVERRRMRKEHALLGYSGYQRAKKVGVLRSLLSAGRQTLRLVFEELPAAWSLARIFRRERADVVHLGNGLRANFDGVLACVMTRTPFVCHIKGFEKYGDRERWAARRTGSLVCMTEAILAYCRGRGIESPDTRVVYDAVDDEWLRPQRSPQELRSELDLPGDAQCIALSGNIQEWKGQRVLVEALALIAEDQPRAHVVIVGGVHRAGEEYARELRARIESLGLGERVHLIGFRDDVPDVMNAMDVVVHASVRPEPFGRVILEGMLLGKPVIAADAGGVPELIADGCTGYLAPPGDVRELAACLRKVLGAPDGGRAMGARARTWAQEKFSLQRHVAEMTEIYERVSRRSNG